MKKKLKNKYKVIIVGAGPSGLSAAINLKKEKVKDILVIEQYEFPRYKCCAGYITSKTKLAYKKLGLDIDSCNYSLIKDFAIYYKYKKKQSIDNKFLYTNKNIDRTELDYNFYKTAKNRKIRILENTKIVNHDMDQNRIILSNGEILTYDNLIFADGTMGFGSKYQDKYPKNIAMQAVFKNETKEKIDIHFGITKKGYAWVSSKDGVTNVGLTDVYNPRINYNKLFADFLNKLNLKCDAKEIKGAFTPIGIRKGIMNSNIYYVGDALGACDPLTLSGLRYGLKSGEMCAKAIKENNNKIYQKYIRTLKIKFKFMHFVQNIFYLKVMLYLIFNVGCRFFSKIIAFVFNNFFVNKK